MDNSYQKQIHHNYLCGGLSKLQKHNAHTDTVLVVGDTRFPCHKAILSAMSNYFAAMFSSGMKESHDDVVTLKYVASEHFEKILNFIYTGELELNYECVYDILQLSSMYQIHALQLICEKFLASDLSLHNCIFHWRMSMTYHCLVLEERSFWFMTEHFLDLTTSKDFLELSKDELIKYINTECLNVQKEEEVLVAVLSWFNHDIDRGVKYFYQISQNLRFPLMDINFVKEIAHKSQFLKTHNGFLDFVMTAVKENQNLPSTEINLNPIAFQSRREHALVMVDGRRQEVSCFTLHSKKLFCLAKFPYFSNAKAACVHNGDIFVSGGSDQPHALVKFTTDHNRWEMCTDLTEGRLFHSMVSLKNSVFILGGFCKNSFEGPKTVEVYKPSTGEIYTVGEIAYSTGKMSAASIGDMIYMVGGSREHYDYLDSDLVSQPTISQCFNTKTNTPSVLCNVPSITMGSQAITVDDSIYIFTPNGYILTVSDGKSPDIIHVLKSVQYHHFRVLYHHGRFYLLQLAAPKVQDEKLVLSWNPQSREENSLLWNKLPRTLLDSHWMKVKISKQHLCYECRR